MSFLFRSAGLAAKAAQAASAATKPAAAAAKVAKPVVSKPSTRVLKNIASAAKPAAKSIKMPAQATKAAKAAASSGAVKTAAKAGIIGGGIGLGGILAGQGVQKAVVEPFRQLGLVQNDAQGNPTLTGTGKIVAIALAAVAIGGLAIYFGGRLLK